MINIIRPIVAPGTHPVETGRYLLATHKIDEMFETVEQWFDNRATGGIIYGRPRLGKSRAIQYLIRTLPQKLGKDIPIFMVCCKQYKQPNEGVFFEDLLNDVGHGLPFSGKANIKRDRLTKYLIEKADTSGYKRIIIFMDDAQRLHEIQYGWLMDIYNALDRVGITLTVILVGQEEIIHQRSVFISERKTQIIGRFMVQQHQFSGIESVEEIRGCLAGYDTDCSYPVESDWSFTRYFFPEAFGNGERLENWAEELYDIFIEERQKAGIKKPLEIPMQYLTSTIEYCLKKFGANGRNEEWLTKAHWKEALKKSGFIEAETYHEIV